MIEISGIELEAEVGQGARSVVHRGRVGDRVVAVKLLRRPSGGDGRAQALQFRREAAALASLRHPCFVEILEVGEQQGQPYLVMEFVAGQTLAQRLAAREAPLPEPYVVRVGHLLAEALAEVHRRGMVHRDIKPQNIIIAESGAPKIIDFGFATRAHAADEPGQIAGTFLYSAPEQTGMLHRPLDGRADLYALGAVLFECVSGRPPFLASEVSELLRMHAVVAPPDLRELAPACSPALAAIVGKLLAKDPDDRYQTGLGLAADLARLDRLVPQDHLDGAPALGADDDPRALDHDAALVGRDPELAQLRNLWARALRGLGCLATVEGDPGSGKSRLVRALFDAVPGGARRGDPRPRSGVKPPRRPATLVPGRLFRPATLIPDDPSIPVRRSTPLPGRATPLVLVGTCEAGEPAPFAPLRQAFAELVRRLHRLPPGPRAEASYRLDAAAGDARELLARFSPDLRDMLSETGPEGQVAPLEANDQLHAALADYLVALAHQHEGLLLVIEDAQWIDDSSLRVLRGLAGRLSAAPLLAVVTSRGEPRVPQELGPGAHRVQLAPLAEPAVAALIAALLGRDPGPQIVAQIATRSAGNPRAVGEYLRAMQFAGLLRPHWGGWVLDADGLASLQLPDDVLQLVVGRIAHLGAGTRELLVVAAVVGARFDPALLTRVSQRPRESVDAAVRDGVAARLLERAPAGRHAFVHDGVREALLAHLGEPARRELHQRVALALDRGDATPPADIYARARHYDAGDRQDPARLISACTAAGLAALADHASEQAYAWLSLAHREAEARGLPQGPALRSALADVCSTTGRLAEAEQHIEGALARSAAPIEQALLHWRQARVRLYNLENERALVDIGRAFAAIGEALPRARAGDLVVTLWTWFVAWFMRSTGVGHGRAVGERRERDRLLGQLYDEAGRILYFEMHDLVFAQAVVRQSRPAARLGPSTDQARADALQAILLATLDRRRLAARAAARALAMAEQLGDPATLARVKLYAAWTHEFCGRISRAEHGLREVLRDDSRWLESWWFLTGTQTLCVSLWIRGHAREALELAEYAIARIEERSSSRGREREQQLAVLHAMVPAILAMLGRGERGAAYLERARSFFTARPDDRFWRTIMMALALAYHVEQGELGGPVEQTLADFQQLGLRPARVSFYARYYYAFQVHARQAQALAADESDRAAATARLAAAIAELQQVPDHPIWRGFLLPARAVLALLSQRTDDALARLAEAEALALELDHLWLRFEVLRLRARVLAARGRPVAAAREASFALGIAVQHGWEPRAAALRREHDLRSNSQLGAGSNTVAEDVQTLRLRRHLDALLELSVASASVRSPAEQSRVALDELVRILAAERAYLFLCRPGDGALELKAGRDHHGRDLDELAGYSRTLVEAVRDSQAPVVLSSGAQGPVAAAESVRTHDLRSVMAAPMVMKDRLVGVVYLDNRLVRGAFTSDDVEILVSIANHIAIGLETARAAALEVQVAASVRERSILLEHATRSVGIGIALLREDGGLVEESPTLLQMTAAWPDLAAWWAVARAQAAAPAASPCPRCGAPQHLGRVVADLTAPGGARQVFELTYTGHSHALAREGGDHVVLISDISERTLAEERTRQLNLDLTNARDQAMAASRSKSAFLANMSHELRTPLNAIIGYSEILLEESEGQDNGDLRKIRTAGNHLLGIISSVLDLSKIEAGKMGVDLVEFDVRTMLGDVLDTARPLVAANANLLQHRVDPAVQVMVTDETKLRQILLNLLSNSAKFTRRGRVELIVSRRMLGGFNVVEFAVHDTGIGIPQDQIARLFEDFQQADNSTTRRYGGTGLGLTIVDRYCSMLGGTVEVESVVDRGSVFRVVLPERVR